MVEANAILNVSLSVPFNSADTASLVQEVLNVDKELKSSGVKREITVNGDILLIKFNGPDLKKVRVSVKSTIKSISLIVKTIGMFPEPS